MRPMHRPQRLGQQVIDHPTQQLSELEPEQLPGVVVHEHDLARAGDDQRGVRGGVQQRPREIVAIRLEQR